MKERERNVRCGDGCDGLEIDFATISRDDKGTIAIDVEREGCAQEVERVGSGKCSRR